MEHKQTEPIILNTDDSQGIVEAIWAVMGNVDGGNDVIHPGAFTKTFTERTPQVRLLDNHRTDSVMSALGTVLELKEMDRGELPAGLTDRYPEANGGAWGRFQFLLDTPEGKGAFTRIKQGAVKEWSFGYDAIQRDHGSIEQGGRKIPVRNLREIKLWEVSPVLWGMNPATAVLNAKSAQPSEGKPWRAIREGDKWEVYKLDSEGNPTGQSLGSHDSQEEANAQVSALYANEDKAGRVYSARNLEKIRMAYHSLREALDAAGLLEEITGDEEGEKDNNGATEPQESDALTSNSEAEPLQDESTRQIIELELEKLKLLEV